MLRRMILLTLAFVLFSGTASAQSDSATPPKTDTATTADAPKPAGRFTPSKAQIQAGQEFLKGKKLYTGEASGKYNPDTRAAIRVFQKDNALTLTGNFNQVTLEKMNIPLTDKQKGTASTDATQASATPATPVSSAKTISTGQSTKTRPARAAPVGEAAEPAVAVAADTPKKPAPFQATKDQIVALQKVLKEAKLFAGEADGARSEALKEAVKKYQEANGLKATGGINAATLEKMGIELTDTQKANVAAQAAYEAGKKN